MTVEKIYFDMDGVLADFNRAVVELCGIPAVNQGHSSPKQHDILFAAMRKVDHFYDKLELMPGAEKMFQMVYEKYGERCEILTGIPKPRRGITTASEDKIKWMHRMLSPKVKVNAVYRDEKKNFCKGPEYILIDDFKLNINQWEAFGGTGIWHQDSESTIQKLKKLEIL